MDCAAPPRGKLKAFECNNLAEIKCQTLSSWAVQGIDQRKRGHEPQVQTWRGIQTARPRPERTNTHNQVHTNNIKNRGDARYERFDMDTMRSHKNLNGHQMRPAKSSVPLYVRMELSIKRDVVGLIICASLSAGGRSHRRACTSDK